MSCAVCPASRGCTPVIGPRPAQLTRRVSHAYAMQKFPGPCREAGQATNELGSTLHDSRVARPSRRRPIRRLFSMAYVSASTRLGRCKNGHPPPITVLSDLSGRAKRGVVGHERLHRSFLFFVDLVESPACTCGGTLPTCCVAYTQQVDGELQPRAKTQ